MKLESVAEVAANPPVAGRRPSPGEKLLPTQRQSFILDVLTEQGVATLHQLSERLGASFSTVRRDLDELKRRGLVARTHGGARLGTPPAGAGGHAGRRSATQSGDIQLAKAAIGRLAATRIEDGQSVIFDSSTTVLEAARVIAASRLRITAVTNNIQIAAVLAESDAVRLIVPGGSRRPGTYVLSGEPGDSFFGRLHADVALLGAQSASNGRLTDSRIEGASAKRLILAAVRTPILLIDAWKFGGPGFCDVAALTDFAEIITDSGLPEDARRDLERRTINVKIAEFGPGVPPAA